MIRSIYFFLRPFHSAQDAGYQHRLVALAEGLCLLGTRYFSNINYWKLGPDSPQTLFAEDPSVLPEDCDVVVCEHVYYDAEHRLPAPYSSRQRKYRTVFVDASDGWRTPSMPAYSQGIDLVLRCHFNARFNYGRNVRPWAFGLSNRITDALKTDLPFKGRERTILCNYRTFHPVRKAAERRFIPLLRSLYHVDRTVDSPPSSASEDHLLWEQSGRRHYSAYYERMLRSAACSAFGGYFVPAISVSVDSPAQRIVHKAASSLGLRTRTVAQFDSWRFWESLAAGCVTFHVDLEKYGCRLPVMPENGKHYVGVDFRRPAETARQVLDGTINLENIAAEGQRWVLDHYSPAAVARRFLEYVEAV